MRKFEAAPVTILRPVSGVLQVVEVIENPIRARFENGYENEVETYKFRIIAVQETGEEMFAGYATSWAKACDFECEWLEDHQEHRGCRIEKIRGM